MEKNALIQFIQELKKANKLIIVEGIKDKRALNKLGVNNYIVSLSKKQVYAVIEDVSKITTEVIILTDFDKKGKELFQT